MTLKKYLPSGELNPKWKSNSSGKSGRSGKRGTSMSRGEFIAWDGEGADVNGKHEYILLRHSAQGVLARPSGLSTHECLSFIIQEAKKFDNRTIHICFGMSYDVNMMLRDIPRSSILRLWKGDSIEYGIYHLTYRHRKQLTIRECDPREKWRKRADGTYYRHYLYSVSLWDVFGFFQSSFVDALDTWLTTTADPDEIAEIKAQKQNRHQFDPSQMETISHYCGLEVSYLAKLGARLHQHLREVDLTLTRWDGAGSVAASIYKKHQIKTHMDRTPVESYAAYAYAGGRIELLQYGTHAQKVYTYDLNSAYPAAMVALPSLSHHRWRKCTRFNPGSFGLWFVDFTYASCGPDKELSNGPWLFPFFYRNKQGSVRYPARVSGWYWTPEVESALRHYPECVHIHWGYVLEDTGERPFSFVHELYAKRQEWKTKGLGAQLVLKLGINSLYGKLAQQVGGYSEKDKVGVRPPYHQLEWAGYITSLTRARLFEAAMQKPHAVVFLATDGICTTEPLSLEVGSALGQWSCTEHDGVVTVQSGVYFYLDTPIISYYRGFDKGALDPFTIQEAWSRDHTVLASTTTRFHTMGSALQSEEQWKLWRTWDQQKQRTLALTPLGTKRFDALYSPALWKYGNPCKKFLRTVPTPFPGGYESCPYKIAWQEEGYAYHPEEVVLDEEISDVCM